MIINHTSIFQAWNNDGTVRALPCQHLAFTMWNSIKFTQSRALPRIKTLMKGKKTLVAICHKCMKIWGTENLVQFCDDKGVNLKQANGYPGFNTGLMSIMVHGNQYYPNNLTWRKQPTGTSIFRLHTSLTIIFWLVSFLRELFHLWHYLQQIVTFLQRDRESYWHSDDNPWNK